MILLNPQWQGGGESSTLAGAAEIEARYLKGQYPYEKVAVDPRAMSEKAQGILGHRTLLEQTRAAFERITAQSPERLLTIGGSCDADLASLAAMNAYYNGDLTVLWFDAHGDMNAPEESASGLFYGMPARMLMAPTAGFEAWVPRPVRPEQWVQIGGRDFDAAEKAFMCAQGITHLPTVAEAVTLHRILAEKGHRHIYIHFDLDVLDPGDFSATPLPVAQGMPVSQAQALIVAAARESELIGFGLFEYRPTGQKQPVLTAILKQLLPLMD